MDPYRALLTKVHTCREHQELQPYAPFSPHNIFHTLGIDANEVIMCRFLADLWNPEGAHGYGTLFLKSFLRQVLHEDRICDKLLAHTDVVTEYVIEQNRRIDIVIRNARFFIPIEVKIYAGEQKGQCFDYASYGEGLNHGIRLVYLTRFGTVPSEYSRKQADGPEVLSTDHILCISWEHDICGWLTGLLSQLKEPLASIIMEYIDAIHGFADGREARMMNQTMELLYESADHFHAGIQIEKTMKAAKLRLIRLVLEDFRHGMDCIASNYGLALEQESNYYSYEDECHEKFYDCYSTYPGLNYVVTGAEFRADGLQMWFRIEVEHRLFAGFCLFDRKAPSPDGRPGGYQVEHITPTLQEEAARYLDRDVIAPSDWWLACRYPNGRRQEADYADVPNFKEMNPCAIQLADEQTRTAFVKHAVKTFEEQLLKHLLL